MMVKLNIPPGVYRNNTAYATGLRWYDVNLVRWVDNSVAPIGGWQQFVSSAIDGTCRGLHAWKDNDGDAWLAVGTNTKLYAHEGGTLTDITPVGFAPGGGTSVPGRGFGVGLYGAGLFGTPRATETSIVVAAAAWSFDTFGDMLLSCCTSDGKIYEWNRNVASPATVVTNAPITNSAVMVSEQRHVVALGAGGDPRAISWSDAEDRNDWTPSSANQSGDWLLNTSGIIRCGVKTRGEILILTSSDAHAMRFIGSPLVFSFDRVGSNCGIAGANAAVPIDGGVAWFGTEANIYVYDGAVRQVPCEVQDWLRQEYDPLKQAEVYGGSLSEHGEIWWYFTAKDATRKYVIFNHLANTWNIGTLDRTAWIDRGVWKYPVAASTDGFLYQHEDGTTDSGATRVNDVYAETGFGEISEGEGIMDVVQLIPDEKTRGDIKVTIKSKFTPNGDETTYGPYTVRSDGYTDTRASGRQIKVRYEPVGDTEWRVGTYRADIRSGGQR